MNKKQEKEVEKSHEPSKSETMVIVEDTEEELIEEAEQTDYIDDMDNITDEEYFEAEEEIEILPEEETIDCPRCGKKFWKMYHGKYLPQLMN